MRPRASAKLRSLSRPSIGDTCPHTKALCFRVSARVYRAPHPTETMESSLSRISSIPSTKPGYGRTSASPALRDEENRDVRPPWALLSSPRVSRKKSSLLKVGPRALHGFRHNGFGNGHGCCEVSYRFFACQLLLMYRHHQRDDRP